MIRSSIHARSDWENLLRSRPNESRSQTKARLAALKMFASAPARDAATLTHITAQLLPDWEEFLPDIPELRVLQAIAAHPNTPPELLARLAFFAPYALARNPAVPLLALEQPGWLHTLSQWARKRLLRGGVEITALVHQIANSTDTEPHIREEARLTVALAGEADPNTCWEDIRAYWRQHVAEANAESHDLYTEFAIVGLLPDWAAHEVSPVRLARARETFAHAANPLLPAAERAYLQNHHEFWVVRAAALLNPQVSAEEKKRRIESGCLHLQRPLLQYGVLHEIWKRRIESEQDILRECQRALMDFACNREAGALLPLANFAGWRLCAQTTPECSSAYRSNFRHARNWSWPWTVSLGWICGVRSPIHRGWKKQEHKNLRAMTRDSNRWVRAVARARLADPRIYFEW